MSLDVYLKVTMPTTVWEDNITHNLREMAQEAGIYMHVWRPEEIGITHAHQLIAPLEAAAELMRKDPARFEKHNPPNGWGSFTGFRVWLYGYIAACKQYPHAEVHASR
jgi:hypothetical protein